MFQISSLSLHIPLSDEFEEAVREALAYQDALVELHIVIRSHSEGYRGDGTGILESLASLTGLKSLSLSLSFGRRLKDLDLSTLRSLQSLRLRDGTQPRLQRSLLEASRATLVEVDVGENKKMLQLLSQCPLLRSVTLCFEPDLQHLHHLKALKNLHTLRLWLRSSWSFCLRDLSGFLDENPQLTWRLSIEVPSLRDASPSVLERVCWLEISCNRRPHEWMERLEAMPNLRELLLLSDRAELQRVVQAWNDRTAPALRVLHLHGTAAEEGRPVKFSLGPKTKICLGTRCQSFGRVFPGECPRGYLF